MLLGMAQRRTSVTFPTRKVTYGKSGDAWQVTLSHGARIIRREPAATKDEAIAVAKALLEQWTDATLELCVLGHCFAWETPRGWVYSRTPDSPNAEHVRVLDELGTVLLERRRSGYVEFIEGAKSSAACSDGSSAAAEPNQ